MYCKSQAKLTIEVNNLETLLMEVAQRSADQNNYILVIYGSRFSEELRELVYQPERHDAFSIHVDVSTRVAALCPSGSITVLFTLSSIPNRSFRLWSVLNP